MSDAGRGHSISSGELSGLHTIKAKRTWFSDVVKVWWKGKPRNYC